MRVGLVYSSIFAGIRVVAGCVLVYARTHTQATWVLDVSPGVGWTPGEPKESRSSNMRNNKSNLHSCVTSFLVLASHFSHQCF